MPKNTLQFEQLNEKMVQFALLKQIAIPPTGWLKAIRMALGMSMQQLGKKLTVSRQNILDIEKREKDGAITIKSLREIAKALDMQFVYGFVPNAGSLDSLIENRAKELAKEIVLRTAQTMKLEDQENSPQRIQKAIEERTEKLKKEIPKILWD